MVVRIAGVVVDSEDASGDAVLRDGDLVVDVVEDVAVGTQEIVLVLIDVLSSLAGSD